MIREALPHLRCLGHSTALAALCLAPLGAQELGGWSEPDGGWSYVYEAFDGQDLDENFGNPGSLDGTWRHTNGSDSWDGSGPGDPFRPDGVTSAAPGGAGTLIIPGAGDGGIDAEVLSIVDTGDPRARGFPDPSNRKTWFCRDLSQDGVNAGGSLRDGLTLIVRSRLHPDVDPDTPGWQLPDGGLDNDAGQGVAPGYTLRDGGKGGHGFYDSLLDRNFSLVPYGANGYQLPPQVGEGLPPVNFLDLGDNTVFHALWVVIQAGTQADRFDVTVYVDGSTTPHSQFTNIILGDDTDCDGINHLHMGFHSTPQVGGMQVDYFGYIIGATAPSSPCPGGFAAAFNEQSGEVALSWSPVPATVDSYTIRRDGADLATGIADSAGAFTDASPPRPSATYELVPIVGGAPRPGCAIASVTIETVVCPTLACVPDKAAGKVDLSWTAPQYFTATGYTVLRDGNNVGSAPGTATSFADTAPPGEHTYELVIASTPADACPVSPFCEARLPSPGSIEIRGDDWNRVVTSGVASIVTTTDGVKSLHFPDGPKTTADSAAFAVDVRSLGTEEIAAGRYRVEIRARYDNEVRITNLSADPVSFIQFDLSRTGVSTAADDLGNQDLGPVEQVPNPGGDPTIDSGSSTIVNTDTIGIALFPGLNLLTVQTLDAGGAPHQDNMQIFELRIGAFATGLDAPLTDFPCAAGLACERDCDGDVTLTWTSSRPHAYELERDGTRIATIPMGNTTTYTDAGVGNGFFTYTLRTTDDPLCPPITCLGGGGVPDPTDGGIRQWLVFGPLDWGCTAGCDAPGPDAIIADYLAGTTGGSPVSQATVAPVDGDEIALGAQATVRATARADINPGRPGTGRWFSYTSPQSLIDYNGVFGADPGNNYMVYAVTYVNNTTGANLVADIGLTSDDAVEVYLDEQSIWVNNVARGVGQPGSAAWDIIPGVTLGAGLNRILVKVFEGGGDNGFALRFEEFGIPILEGLEIVCEPVQEVRFVRGDPDSSGVINLTDGIVVLNFLFTGGAAPKCMDAADTDDANANRPNITDAIRIFNWLFTGGAAPVAPTPAGANYPAASCGPDPTPNDGMACLQPAQKCL